MTRSRVGLIVILCIAMAMVVAGRESVRAFVVRDMPQDVTLAETITTDELETDYGIRLTLVGVTAAGGLVDIRFSIVDLDKAVQIFNDPDIMPAVYVPDTNTFLAPRHGSRHHQIDPEEGASYFMHLANEGGAVTDGTMVTVVFNQVKVEDVRAQS